MFSIIKIDNFNKWDEIVKSFKDYDVYYLSSYTKAFQIHGDGEPLLIYYEDGTIRAINVVMKRDISKDKHFSSELLENSYFDITTPYGYGGFLIDGEVTQDNLKRLNDEYISLCKRNGIISEFVRFHPVLNNCNSLENIYDISRLGKTITINLESQEQIWNDLTPKNRNVIRKAIKSGIEIFWGRSAELYSRFIEIYNSTMDRDNAKDYYYFQKDFYDSVLYDLKYNTMMFYAVYQGNIIAMSMILFSNQQMHYHLSASNREYQSLAPTNLLLFEVACWGVMNGYKSLHLGGGLGSSEDNLFKFKKAFNRNSDNTFTIGKKIFDMEKYNELITIRRNDSSKEYNHNFFPEYRG
jgi:hypothetical protein